MQVLKLEEETLRGLGQFSSVAEMNEVVRAYKEGGELGASVRAVLDVISQYACKYVGVCYLSKQKLAEGAGFTSRRTAIRACRRLEDLGMIKQYETRRVHGDKRRSVNIIVIQKIASPEAEENPFIKEESQGDVTTESHSKEALYKAPIKANTYKETWKDTEDAYKRGLKLSIPAPFYEAFSPFFNAKELYEIYGILLRAKATVKKGLFNLEEKAEEYVDYFYNVIRLYKWGKVRNLKGYLYRTWEWLSKELYRQEFMRQKKSDSILLISDEEWEAYKQAEGMRG